MPRPAAELTPQTGASDEPLPADAKLPQVTACDVLCSRNVGPEGNTSRRTLCTLVLFIAGLASFQVERRNLKAAPPLSQVALASSAVSDRQSDLPMHTCILDGIPARTDSQIATIIAMDLRNVEDTGRAELLNQMTQGTDVFVCTDAKYYKRLTMLTNVQDCRFSEEDGGYSHLVNQSNMIQWWRLQTCWSLVQRFENKHGFKYKFYFKLRTDCGKAGQGCPPSFESFQRIMSAHGPTLTNVVFCRSDYAFGGTADSFDRIATLFSRIGQMYWRKEALYYRLDYDLLLRCDWTPPTKWHWLNHPKLAVQNGCCHRADIERSLEDLKGFVDSGQVVDGPTCNLQHQCSEGDASRPSQAVTGFPGVPGRNGFASEKVLLLDLLLAGIEVRHY